MARQSSCITFALLAIACGPSVDVEDGGSTSDGTAHGEPGSGPITETTSPTSSPSTTSATSPSTTEDPGTADDPTTTDADSNGIVDPGLDLPQDCDLWLDDCPPGSKCMPYSNDGGNDWNATKCTPLARDPNQVGEPCTVEGNGVSGVDDCEASAMCWNVDPDTNVGECAAFCKGSEAEPMCADACSECHISGGSPLILCLPICDPLVQDCGEGQGCYAAGASLSCAPDASDGAGLQGDPCEFLNVCAPGFYCANADTLPDCTDATGCCTAFCDVASADPCADAGAGVECVPWGNELPCSAAMLGACLLPA